MKKIQGVWLPDHDDHFEGMMAKTKPQKLPDGRQVGVYQWQKLHTALLECPRRRVALDIGAHVGLWSMWLGFAFQRLYAFEPVREHIECWRLNMADQENAHLYEFAIGAQPGRASMSTSSNTGMAHIISAQDKPTDVEVRTLDSLLLDEVDFVKIDVEGFESAVIHGGRATLERNRPIIVVENNGQAGRYAMTDPVVMLQGMGAKVLHELRHDIVLGWPEC